MEKNLDHPQKLGIDFSCDPAIPLHIYPLMCPATLFRKDICSSLLDVALFIIGKIWKQHKCPKIKGKKKQGLNKYVKNK